MPKKSKVELEDFETPELMYDPEPEIKISKRTGKPTRPLTELQKETLAKGRELAIAKRKELLVGIDLAKRAETINKAKQELKSARDLKQQEKLEQQKKQYEEAIKEETEEEEEEEKVVKVSKPKKIKKKVIKYVEASSSESEEEEIIYKKKKNNKPKEKSMDEMKDELIEYQMKKRLYDVRSSSLANLMMPSYF